MGIYDIAPYFVILGVCLALFHFAPVFKFIDEPAGKNRVSTLDGLRGFLALSVFIHHAVVTHDYINGGGWVFPPSRFYGLLGQVAVAYFFMISGFLFWGKLVREQKRVNWRALYIGRVFRIVPVYLVAIFAMFLIVFIRTDFELREPAGKIANEILRWFGFGFFGKPDVNGYEHTRLILAAVTWSLYFEWIFYFSLRATYYLSGPKLRLPFVLTGLGLSIAGTFLLRGGGITYTALFFAGMTAATLIHDGYRPKIDARLGALGALACPMLVFLCFPELHNGFSVLLLAVSFFIICLGNSLFGLLTTTGAQRLGHISYSVYLMQGIALTLFYWTNTVKNYALANDGNYWLTVMLCALLLALGSAVLYGIVERPGIGLGRKLIARVRKK